MLVLARIILLSLRAWRRIFCQCARWSASSFLWKDKTTGGHPCHDSDCQRETLKECVKWNKHSCSNPCLSHTAWTRWEAIINCEAADRTTSHWRQGIVQHDCALDLMVRLVCLQMTDGENNWVTELFILFGVTCLVWSWDVYNLSVIDLDLSSPFQYI